MTCCWCFFCFNSEEEDAISSDEDVPFRDDLNDQSYDPKYEKCVFVCSEVLVSYTIYISVVFLCRDFPKARRRPPTRLKEKKDKAALPETATEQETEIKTEGGESTDVQTAAEVEEGAEPPRKWVSDDALCLWWKHNLTLLQQNVTH